MKIRFWDRLILFLGALITLAAGAFLAVCGLQITGVLGEALSMTTRIICIAGGALLILLSGYLFLFPRRFRAGRHNFIVQQTDNGELRIAVKAIENLVQKCVDMHDEIELNSMRIRNAREGVTVDMNISLARNISIPLAVASLQKQIKQYLVASSGIEVKEVRVSVDTAAGEADDAAASPYLVPSQEQAQEKPAPEQAKPRVPLHQRLFSRPEEEATVPEPPKAEEETAPAAEPAAEDAQEAPVSEEDAAERPAEAEEESDDLSAAPEEDAEKENAP